MVLHLTKEGQGSPLYYRDVTGERGTQGCEKQVAMDGS